MTLTAAQPSATSALPDLIDRIGAGDHDAFCALYTALAPTVLAAVQTTLPEPGQAMNVSRATFVEVWWLSRHSGRHGHDITDVRTWILAIAARRANERRRILDLANGSSFLAALRCDHDQHTCNQLTTMFRPPAPHDRYRVVGSDRRRSS